MIVARQFIAWNVSEKDPSRRVRSESLVSRAYANVRLERPTSLAVHKNYASDLADVIIPFPTGRIFLGHVPGNKLPGYYHRVPTGQLVQYSVTSSQ